MSSGVIAFLFDFGGVLLEAGFRNGRLTMAREQGLYAVELSKHAMRAVYDPALEIILSLMYITKSLTTKITT